MYTKNSPFLMRNASSDTDPVKKKVLHRQPDGSWKQAEVNLDTQLDFARENGIDLTGYRTTRGPSTGAPKPTTPPSKGPRVGKKPPKYPTADGVTTLPTKPTPAPTRPAVPSRPNPPASVIDVPSRGLAPMPTTPPRDIRRQPAPMRMKKKC